jgi:hypothetical protein
MTVGAWRLHADHPAPGEMPAPLGDRGKRLWRSLTGWLRATYGLEGEVAWTDDEAGWVLRYRWGGRSLVTLFPLSDGSFTALVVLGPTCWAAVDDLALSERAWEAFNVATPYADGRWLWLRVHGPETVGDVRRLVGLKAPPPGLPGTRPLRPVMDAKEIASRSRERERELEVSGIR